MNPRTDITKGNTKIIPIPDSSALFYKFKVINIFVHKIIIVIELNYFY